MRYQVGAALCILALMCLCVVGCEQHPMVTSLGDLRSERRVSESDAFYFQEIITLDGSNPTQQVGRPIHYGRPYVGLPTKVAEWALHPIWPLWPEGDLNPATAFPIEIGDSAIPSQSHTYVRTGSCETPGAVVVRDIAMLIDQVQIETLGLVELRVQLAQALNKEPCPSKTNAVAQSDDSAKPQKKAETDEKGGDADSPAVKNDAGGQSRSGGVNASSEATGVKKPPAKVTTFDPIQKLRDDISAKRDKIAGLRKQLHYRMSGKDKDGNPINAAGADPDESDINRTGVMIVRWAAASSGGAGADAGKDILKADVQASRRQSGYVILGGIEISQLVVGHDMYEQIVKAYAPDTSIPLKDKDKIIREMLDNQSLGITIYTLKAKDIAYASDLQTDFNARLNATLSKKNLKNLQNIDSVTLRAELAHAADFSNIGALPALSWKTRPVGFKDRMLPDSFNRYELDRLLKARQSLKNELATEQFTDSEMDEKNKQIDQLDTAIEAIGPNPEYLKEQMHAVSALSGSLEPGIHADGRLEGWSTIYSVVAIPKDIQLWYAENFILRLGDD